MNSRLVIKTQLTGAQRCNFCPQEVSVPYSEEFVDLMEGKQYVFGRKPITIEDRIGTNFTHISLPGCPHCSYTYKCFSIKEFKNNWTLNCEISGVEGGTLFLTECYDPVLYPLFTGMEFTFAYPKAPFKVSVRFIGSERSEPPLFTMPMPLPININHAVSCSFPVYFEIYSFSEPADSGLNRSKKENLPKIDQIVSRWKNLENPNLGKYIESYRTYCLDISHFTPGTEYTFGRIDETFHDIKQQFYVPLCVDKNGIPGNVSYGHFSITLTPYGYVITTKKKLSTSWSVRIMSTDSFKEQTSCLNPVNVLLKPNCRIDVGNSNAWISLNFKILF